MNTEFDVQQMSKKLMDFRRKLKEIRKMFTYLHKFHVKPYYDIREEDAILKNADKKLDKVYKKMCKVFGYEYKYTVNWRVLSAWDRTYSDVMITPHLSEYQRVEVLTQRMREYLKELAERLTTFPESARITEIDFILVSCEIVHAIIERFNGENDAV